MLKKKKTKNIDVILTFVARLNFVGTLYSIKTELNISFLESHCIQG